jgi:hypothetical protein
MGIGWTHIQACVRVPEGFYKVWITIRGPELGAVPQAPGMGLSYRAVSLLKGIGIEVDASGCAEQWDGEGFGDGLMDECPLEERLFDGERTGAAEAEAIADLPSLQFRWSTD